jgi:twinkle protein
MPDYVSKDFVKHHLPCPKCGGSDPVSMHEDRSAYCFSCRAVIKDYEKECDAPFSSASKPVDMQPYRNNAMNNSEGDFLALTDRGISLDSAKKYGVKAVKDHKGQIVKHLYPYYVANEIVGYKVREQNKMFTWKGSGQGSGLFGEQLFQSGGKYVTLVEGECDAMASYEMLGSKWPVVSIKNGAAAAVKDVKNSIEFLEKFDCVVINFDNDRAGKEAAKKVARLLTPGKAKLMHLPDEFKDANDMIKKGNKHSYVTAWWNAKIYTPSGVVNAKDLKDKYFNREKKDSVPYPWGGLNKKLYGLRQGELVTLTGGTGLGKSSITRELEHWLINNTEDNVGIVALEEHDMRTLDCLMSIEANDRLYVDHIREGYDQSYLDEIYSKIYDNGRVWIHAHFGSNDIDEIFSKIRFMIIGCDCKWIIVDHLHMLVSATTEGDERRTIDSIMTRLRSIVEETGAGMVLVSHLRRVEGNRGHENGVTVGLNHLRGSQSIAQLSDCVIALERNQQSDDEEESQTTHVRVLKSRYTGDVGMATHLLYNQDTGRLKELDTSDYQFDGDEL